MLQYQLLFAELFLKKWFYSYFDFIKVLLLILYFEAKRKSLEVFFGRWIQEGEPDKTIGLLEEGAVCLLASMITNGLYLNHKYFLLNKPQIYRHYFLEAWPGKNPFWRPCKGWALWPFFILHCTGLLYSAVKLHFLLFYVHNLSSHTGFMSEWLPTLYVQWLTIAIVLELI